MLPLIKIIAVGGAGAGVLYLTWWMSNGSGDLLFRDLSTDKDFDTTYNNKFASDYSKYFVGVHDEAKEDSPFKHISNKAWWDRAFNQRYKTASNDSKKQGFKEKGDVEAFKAACKSAYQAQTSKVKDNATAGDEFEESNIWLFCSIGGNKPTTVFQRNNEKDSYDNNSYGKTKDKLISVKDENNNWFWDVKEKEFFEMTSYPSDLGETSSNTSKFKKLYEGRQTKRDLNKRHIKELCAEAYSKAATSNTDFPTKVVFKFCSLKGKE